MSTLTIIIQGNSQGVSYRCPTKVTVCLIVIFCRTKSMQDFKLIIVNNMAHIDVYLLIIYIARYQYYSMQLV